MKKQKNEFILKLEINGKLWGSSEGYKATDKEIEKLKKDFEKLQDTFFPEP